ncbi:MAG: LysR family transcriptional regulator [OCS116 cluster bacterium]|nr:LysR family transcriptional regulator [OCS116 cluster bacterium]
MNFETPNIRHLRVFLQVIATKSISKASKKVFLSQPAITQAISKLEGMLKTTLFERRNNGMYVTPSGAAYAHRVERALNIISDGTKAAIRVGIHKDPSQKDGSGSTGHSLQMLTTTQLRALIAVSETQNFSLAGRNIGISQSSLHRSARELESQIGVVFFEKTLTGINISKAAQILAKASKLAFAEISQGQDEVNSLHNREVGIINIGCMPLARTSIVPSAITQFSHQYPDFSFRVGDGSYDDLLSHLRHGDFDMLIGALRFPIPSDDVIQEELFSSSICIVARAGHPLCQNADANTQALSQYPWVVPPATTPSHDIFKSIFSGDDDIPKNLVETSSQILMRTLLLDSDRIGIISVEQIQHELDSGLLQKIPYEIEQGSRPIGITVRKSWEPTKTQIFFIEKLRESGLALNE